MEMTANKKGGVAGRLMAAWAIASLLLAMVPPAVLAAPQGAQSQGKLSPGLERKIAASGADDMVAVIVQTVSEPSSSHFTRVHGRGGEVKSRHAAIRGYSARVPAAQIAALADDPEVERISEDAPVKAHLDVARKAVLADVAVAESGWLAGNGVGIALVDTGVAAHADLLRMKGAPQVIEVEVVGHENGLMDYYGHGTHVAGILNGNGASSSDRSSFRTFNGLAPGAQLISIRALAADGTGYTSDIIAGIDWAIRYRTAYNIRVLNLSLGHPVFESYRTDPMCRAVRAATEAGILVVVAAGNDGGVGSGFGTITAPANEPSALTVGAMDDGNTVTITDDVLAPFSSKGPSLIDFVVKPDMVAPGTWLVSTRSAGSWIDVNYHDLTLQIGDYKNDSRNALKDGAYFTLSGTSMAAPMVAATAALMFEKDASLNPASVKARLMKSAVKDDRLVFETGAGYLDVSAALKASGRAGSALSPLAMAAEDGYIYVQDTGLIWGADWSMGGVWGGNKVKTVLSSELPDSISALGSIWGGGRGGAKAVVDNDMITASGLIWNSSACSLAGTTGSVDNMGAIWGKGKR